MTASNERTRLIRLVQVGRRSLGLDEETYRALLVQQSGKRSAAALSIHELDKVLQAMKGAGFKPTVKRGVKGGKQKRLSPVSGTPVRTAEIGVIRAIWITMAKHGLLRDGSETALDHYVERQTVRLNKGVGVARVAWLDGVLAYSVLESLKHWHKRAMVEALRAAKRRVPVGRGGAVAGYQAVVVAFEQMQAEVQHG
ncbi:regulatory protein GemA [Aeromonas caviae]|uniref:gp16 family protein n=1 Tax=Aeromonas caviae TaxID=648 RepID=UPI001EF0D1DB|nr:regulatory protein GemA [Aeromonas caviae]ULH02513.1 regulatory protein GemA [Aeromonas caviae]